MSNQQRHSYPSGDHQGSIKDRKYQQEVAQCHHLNNQRNQCLSSNINTRNLLWVLQDSSRQRLTWNKAPLSVLVIKKVHDTSVIPPFLDIIRWLIWEKRMVVYVEPAVLEDLNLRTIQAFSSITEQLCVFGQSVNGQHDSSDKVDFIICLGGDGTLLYASSLFQQSVPPVMAFHLGSLGFLAPFEFNNYQEQVTQVLEGQASITLRSRLRCQVTTKSFGDSSRRISEANGQDTSSASPLTVIESNGDKKTNSTCHLVLNEVVVDRGPHPYLSNIDLFIDDKYITTVQGDGLIVSTPTGSTAYAVAAGASMIHPSVPSIMVTPICPHSLSFRPIVVPAGVELKICVSDDSRNSAWVSFDGRKRQELLLGDCLRVTTSIYPVPSICAEDQISDWFDSLAECLHWNVRKKQRQFDDIVDFEGPNNGNNSTYADTYKNIGQTIGAKTESIASSSASISATSTSSSSIDGHCDMMMMCPDDSDGDCDHHNNHNTVKSMAMLTNSFSTTSLNSSVSSQDGLK